MAYHDPYVSRVMLGHPAEEPPKAWMWEEPNQLKTRILWGKDGEFVNIVARFGDTTLIINRDDLIAKAKEGDLLCSFLVEQITRAKLVHANEQKAVDGSQIIGYRRVIPQVLANGAYLVADEESI